MTADSPIVAARRERLRQWIEDRHAGVQAGFVAATGINQGELSLLLKNKSFGERKAEAIEVAAGMPTGYLTNALDVQPPSGVVGRASQPARYDPDILADAMTLLDELDKIQGRKPAERPNPARLAIACEVIAGGGMEDGRSVVVRLADRFRQQGQGNGNDAGSDSGVGTADGGSAGAAAAAKSSRRRAG